MPAIYQGILRVNDEEFSIRAMFGKDIKINLYKLKNTERGFDTLLKSGLDVLKGITGQPEYDIIGSYVSFTVKDEQTKKLKRNTHIYGNIDYVHKILDLYEPSYLPQEETRSEKYPSHRGLVYSASYRKVLTGGEIVGNFEEVNGILESLDVKQITPKKVYHLELNKTNKSAKVGLTEGLTYHESLFDIGNVREAAVNAQVRSIQHLRTIKNLDWIDALIEQGKFRIIDTLPALQAEVKRILSDLLKINERKIYYDTEGTGLKVFNLPPDHPDFDKLSTHVLSWVTERREDGYPLNVETIAIPVGMKFCDNIDEIEAIEALRPLLTNPNIGVVSHNSDYETQINLRYSEIEGELSYREYYKWKKTFEEEAVGVDREYIEKQIKDLKKELEEEQAKSSGIMAKVKTAPIRNKIEQLTALLNVDIEMERVRNLPKEQKPYISKVKGEDIFRVNVKYDTLVLSRMANNGALDKEGRPFLRHALEILTKNYLDLEQLSLDDIYGNGQSSQYRIYDFSLLPREFMLYYACPDTYVMPFVEWHLERQAYNNMMYLGLDETKGIQAYSELLKLYYEVDVPFALHMAEFANYKGMAIDKDKLDRDKEQQEEAVELLLNLLTELTGEEDIKWSSTKQVAPLVFTKFRYPVKFKTTKGEDSYNKRTRKFHSAQKKDKFDPEYADVVDLPEMKEDLVDSSGNVILKKDVVNNLKCPLSYIYQAYMDRFKDLTSFTKMIYERTYYINGEWIYFPSYISTSTDTGRASGGTMIMKASKKSTFIARKNHIVVGGDLDQAELRLIATMAQDLEDITHFKDPRYDPHTKTGAQIGNVPITEVGKEQRDAAKVINFGYFYGMQEKSCAENIYRDMVPVPEPLILKVKIMLKDFAKANRIKVNWLNNLRDNVQRFGYSKTPMGRYKWFPEIKSDDIENWELARVARQGGNVPIQGLCADFIKQRLVAIFKVIKECNISRFFTQPLFIHDEFHAEVNVNAFKNASNEVYDENRVAYEQQFNLLWLYHMIYSNFTERPLGFSYLKDEAPMTLGIGLGANWDQAKSDLHGCPQELQIALVKEYREGRVDNEFFSNLCKTPIETMLNRIRQWWAMELVKEIEKVTTLDNIPRDIGDKIEDLFIRRNLKDIFPVSPKELVEMGLKDDEFTLGQILKALRFLKGEKITFVDVLKDDKLDISEDSELLDSIIEGEVIDLEHFRKIREDGSPTDYEDYDEVFRESSLLEFGKVMVHENGKVLELNIDGLMQQTVKNLEILISKQHDDAGAYGVVIIAQKADSSYPYKTIKTTYKVNINEDLLLNIKTIYEKNRELELEYYRKLA